MYCTFTCTGMCRGGKVISMYFLLGKVLSLLTVIVVYGLNFSNFILQSNSGPDGRWPWKTQRTYKSKLE